MFYMLKHNFKTQLKSWKTNHFLNDSKRRRMALSCSKQLPALLRRVTSKHDGNFHLLNCPHSCQTKKQKNEDKNRNKDFCDVVIHSKDIKILEFNQYKKIW